MKKILHHLKAEWYKYVLEIMVITIGILGAFALNNWNEERRLNKKQKVLLLELKENLNNNIQEFHANIQWEEDRIQGINKILDYADNDKAWDDSIAMEFKWLITKEEFYVTYSAYESLKISGLEVISSDKLRSQLSKLYTGKYQLFTERINDYANELLVLRVDGIISQTRFDDERRTLIPNNPDKFLDNVELINQISHRLFMKKWVIEFNQEVIASTQEVLETIDEELMKL